MSISNNCLDLLFMTSRIKPHVNNMKPKITRNPQTINVGKRGTNPVYMYSKKIGVNKIAAIVIQDKDNAEKNKNGL